MTHWPALDRWQHPEYLLAVAGQRTVPIELGKHYLEEGWGQSLISLGDFLRRHVMQAGLLSHVLPHDADIYLSQDQPCAQGMGQ